MILYSMAINTWSGGKRSLVGVLDVVHIQYDFLHCLVPSGLAFTLRSTTVSPLGYLLRSFDWNGPGSTWFQEGRPKQCHAQSERRQITAPKRRD
jgi:hypothetical protein